MIEPAKLESAIAAHAKWKFRLREAMQTGKSGWTVESVRPENDCDFGRWLNSLPLADRMSREWKEAKALHARFHQVAADVLQCALEGKGGAAAAAMAPGGSFSEVSTKLVRLLTEWKQRVSGEQPE